MRKICERKGVELLVVIAPLLPDYKSAIPGEVQQLFNATTAKLKVISVNIELANSDYYNADHLNLNGAKSYSKALQAALRK